jgi:hypothetical protein
VVGGQLRTYIYLSFLPFLQIPSLFIFFTFPSTNFFGPAGPFLLLKRDRRGMSLFVLSIYINKKVGRFGYGIETERRRWNGVVQKRQEINGCRLLIGSKEDFSWGVESTKTPCLFIFIFFIFFVSINRKCRVNFCKNRFLHVRNGRWLPTKQRKQPLVLHLSRVVIKSVMYL